jgi:hypothetical protein
MTDVDAYRFDGVLPIARAVETLEEYQNSETHSVEIKIVPKDGENSDE